MDARRLDRAIRKVAASQYGAFSAAQARSAGATKSAMHQRLRRGDIERVADGVYVLPGAMRCWRQRV
ncbi:MAG: type IV toxin-antitoxin system AbiEi family antitoxin domain-containing protein, partial [Acidimicrobiia bacterium]|nr:type IV toxin-antitoxin system AbiEi family antitoxin domain-containing protein [Acidimicrobiia bacterium]